MRKKMLIFLTLLCLMLAGAGYMIQQRGRLQEELRSQELQLEVTQTLLQEVRRLRAENEELRRRMQEWLDTWDVSVAEVTAYAPLDPAAKEGMCYEGDPHVTASGAEVVPGVTAAAGPDVEFGTRIYIHGHGMRVVQDRGGRIGPGCIDLAVGSREEALAWGRKKVKVVYQK